MNDWVMWFVILAALLTLLLTGALMLVVLRVCKGLIESLKPVLIRQLELVDKATSIAASKDLAAYQGIAVMSQPVVGYDGDTYDASDEAEWRRETERRKEDPEVLRGEADEELRDLFS